MPASLLLRDRENLFMNARGDNPLHIMVIAASSQRRSALAALAARLNLHTSTSAGISLERISQSSADVVLVDVDDSALSGAVIRLAQALPEGTGLIALADNPEPRWVTTVLHTRINAILARDVTAEELRLAIQTAEAGLVLLHPSSARELPDLMPDHDSSPLVEALTAREQEVLRLVSDGLANKEIADRLKISDHTVKFHISSILGKLGAGSRTEAVSQGIRKGFIVI